MNETVPLVDSLYRTCMRDGRQDFYRKKKERNKEQESVSLVHVRNGCYITCRHFREEL